MTTSKIVLCAAFVATVLASQPASAGIISVSGSVGGAPVWANRLNFDDLALGQTGGATSSPNGTATVSFAGTTAQVVTGAEDGQYAPPVLSGGNGLGFGPGSSNQVNGIDGTNYLTSGINPGHVSIKFAAEQKFLGLLWGSVDDYNTLTFYKLGVLVGGVSSVTGSGVAASPNGNQGVNGTLYVNINTDGFDEVRATSSQFAFEFDNVSYSTETVPDGGATLALLGLALSGLGVLRRRIG